MLVTAYKNGLVAGTPPAASDHRRAKRGQITGWSPASVRRHTRWLYSIDCARLLRDEGVAYTLTLKTTPATHLDWTRLVKMWCDSMQARGARRVHWVVEWQRRGTPHLHAAVYWDARLTHVEGIGNGLGEWLRIAGAYSPEWQSQHAAPIDGAEGWLAYLSKHAARGVRHYQRTGRPDGWESTGRLWGHRGEWPEVDPLQLRIEDAGSYRLRRLVRSWRKADARKALADALAAPLPPSDRGRKAHAARIKTARRRITAARTMLRKNNPERARTMGVSEWMRPEVAGPLMTMLLAEGYRIGFAEDYTEDQWRVIMEAGQDWPTCVCGPFAAPSAVGHTCTPGQHWKSGDLGTMLASS